MWNLPTPGTEPMSPVLAGRFLSTESPGKSLYVHSFKTCNSTVFGIFTELYNYHKTIFRTSSLPPQRNLIPSNSHSPLPSLLGTTNLISVSMNFPTLDISYKWNHIMRGHLWLASSTYNVFKGDHIIASISTSFFLFYYWIRLHCIDTPHFVHP